MASIPRLLLCALLNDDTHCPAGYGVSQKTKRKEKKELLDQVKSWILDNEEKAKEEFEESAQEVITVLINIEEKLQK